MISIPCDDGRLARLEGSDGPSGYGSHSVCLDSYSSKAFQIVFQFVSARHIVLSAAP